MTKDEEYRALQHLEIQTTKTHWISFAILLSVSFILTGLSAQQPYLKVYFFSYPVTFSVLVFLLGFVLFVLAVFQYTWHEYSTAGYRDRLATLEKELGVEIYRHQREPEVGAIKFQFSWMLYAVGVVYGATAWGYAGTLVFLSTTVLIALVFTAFLAASMRNAKH